MSFVGGSFGCSSFECMYINTQMFRVSLENLRKRKITTHRKPIVKMKPRPSLLTLPLEVLAHVAHYMHVVTLLRFRLTCKRLNTATEISFFFRKWAHRGASMPHTISFVEKGRSCGTSKLSTGYILGHLQDLILARRRSLRQTMLRTSHEGHHTKGEKRD